MNNPRIVAARVLLAVLQNGESLTRAELRLTPPTIANQDRSLIRALCFGVLRWYSKLQAISNSLLERPLKNKDQDVQMLLLMGLYQLMEQRVPDYAAVSETVNSCDKLKKPWAKGLLNGALRNFLRQREKLLESVAKEYAIKYAFPLWLVESIQRDWPDDCLSVFAACNEPAPLSLRVNANKISTQDYFSLLQQQQTDAGLLNDFPNAIQLKTPCDISALPMFIEGAVSVQDCAAQLAAYLLAPQKGDRVLDACAAPGGKTGHLLELQTGITELVAIDSDAIRLQRVHDNLQRLGFIDPKKVKLQLADAGQINTWWDQQLFDRVLLDAPCSGTGVIRRHPDIKWLRRESDIATLVKTQAHLLRQCWTVLKPGGTLLYATCSVLKAENEQQIAAFLKEASDAEHLPITLPFGNSCTFGMQLFPGKISSVANLDGFYYALLKKQA